MEGAARIAPGRAVFYLDLSRLGHLHQSVQSPGDAHVLLTVHILQQVQHPLHLIHRPGGTLVRLFPQGGLLGQQSPPLLLPLPQLRQGTVQLFQCTRHIPSLLSPVFSLLFYPFACLRASFPLDFPAEMP